jgi:hypothetical protein
VSRFFFSGVHVMCTRDLFKISDTVSEIMQLDEEGLFLNTFLWDHLRMYIS